MRPAATGAARPFAAVRQSPDTRLGCVDCLVDMSRLAVAASTSPNNGFRSQIWTASIRQMISIDLLTQFSCYDRHGHRARSHFYRNRFDREFHSGL